MTIEAFNVLVDRGYITNVGFVNHYRGNPELLKSKSIEDLAGEGVISKMCADFMEVFTDIDTGEEVIIEKMPDNDKVDFTPPTEKDDETITPTPELNPITPTDDIVVDDENPSIDDVVDDPVEDEDPIDEDVEE
jgi:hypothetical protein